LGKLVGCTQPIKNKERMDLYSPPNPPKTKKELASTQPTSPPPTLLFFLKRERGFVHKPLPPPQKNINKNEDWGKK